MGSLHYIVEAKDKWPEAKPQSDNFWPVANSPYIPFMPSRSQLLNGPLLQDYLWTKYFTLIKSVNLCVQKKP